MTQQRISCACSRGMSPTLTPEQAETCIELPENYYPNSAHSRPQCSFCAHDPRLEWVLEWMSQVVTENRNRSFTFNVIIHLRFALACPPSNWVVTEAQTTISPYTKVMILFLSVAETRRLFFDDQDAILQFRQHNATENIRSFSGTFCEYLQPDP